MNNKKDVMLDFMSGDQNESEEYAWEHRPPMRKNKLINYIDVNEMSNVFK